MTWHYSGKWVVLAVVVGVTALGAEAPKPALPPATPPPQKTGAGSLQGRLNFKPMGRGVPGGRVDAASRGDGDEVASLYVLAPEELGRTSKARPTLYWLQTRAADVPFEFALLRPQQAEPVLRISSKSAHRAGLQHLAMAEHGVTLEPGVEYQWVVALIRDPANRSRDIVSSGWIQRVPPLPMGRPTPQDYATHGIWYDAFDMLSETIREHPGDRHPRAVRDDFLGQVGLPHISAAEGAGARLP